MKKMQIFEPAMCCSTGVCGVSVDPELLRISTVLNSLGKNNVKVERFNLTDAPMEFIINKKINEYVQEKGAEGLPVTMVDGEIVITERYPSNEEFVQLLEVPESHLSQGEKEVEMEEDTSDNSGGCCLDSGCC